MDLHVALALQNKVQEKLHKILLEVEQRKGTRYRRSSAVRGSDHLLERGEFSFFSLRKPARLTACVVVGNDTSV